MEQIIQIINYIKNIIREPEFQKNYKVKQRYFSRKDCGEITFEMVMLFVLFNVKNTLPLAVIDFCKRLNIKNFNASAMSKARQKIENTAFYELFVTISSMITPKKLYKGYQLIAFDGTEIQLPKTNKTKEIYNVKGSSIPKCHLVTAYDTLNKFFIDVEIQSYPTDERGVASDILKRICQSNTPRIYTFDRGFPSVKLINQLEANGLKYIFRISSSFLSETNAFYKSEETEQIIYININERRIATNRIKNATPCSFSLRLVKILLKNGETEVLATNLNVDEFTIQDLYELYKLRWCIETGFNFLKNSIEIEKFNSILENSIFQELYASLIIFNFSFMLINEAEEKDNKKTKNMTIELILQLLFP